jgi:hypothetical protein
MMMLTAYLDESGHSQDQKVRFMGMAGLIATSEYWQHYEREWQRVLKDFQIPYFHMKEYAHSVGVFAGWKADEPKRRALYGELMNVMSETNALPFGSLVPMELFRTFSAQQKGYFKDPYYFVFITCLVIAADLIGLVSPVEETMAMVFSEQSEFSRTLLMDLFDLTRATHPHGRRIDGPIFQNMEKAVPLQGADIVAYEFHKECDRQLYRPQDKPRWGFSELKKICAKSANFFPFIVHDEQTLNMHIRNAEVEHRISLQSEGSVNQ